MWLPNKSPLSYGAFSGLRLRANKDLGPTPDPVPSWHLGQSVIGHYYVHTEPPESLSTYMRDAHISEIQRVHFMWFSSRRMTFMSMYGWFLRLLGSVIYKTILPDWNQNRNTNSRSDKQKTLSLPKMASKLAWCQFLFLSLARNYMTLEELEGRKCLCMRKWQLVFFPFH